MVLLENVALLRLLASQGRRGACSGLRVTGYAVRVTGWAVRGAGYGLRGAGCGFWSGRVGQATVPADSELLPRSALWPTLLIMYSSDRGWKAAPTPLLSSVICSLTSVIFPLSSVLCHLTSACPAKPLGEAGSSAIRPQTTAPICHHLSRIRNPAGGWPGDLRQPGAD